VLKGDPNAQSCVQYYDELDPFTYDGIRDKRFWDGLCEIGLVQMRGRAKSLFDIGPGTALHAHEEGTLSLANNYYGAEPSKNMISIARNRYGNCDFRQVLFQEYNPPRVAGDVAVWAMCSIFTHCHRSEHQALLMRIKHLFARRGKDRLYLFLGVIEHIPGYAASSYSENVLYERYTRNDFEALLRASKLDLLACYRPEGGGCLGYMVTPKSR